MAATIRRRRALRWFAALLWLLLALVVAAAIGGYLFMRGSLPVLEGRVLADGLRAPVTVTRDANGVPTIRGSDRSDRLVASRLDLLGVQRRDLDRVVVGVGTGHGSGSLASAGSGTLDHNQPSLGTPPAPPRIGFPWGLPG